VYEVHGVAGNKEIRLYRLVGDAHIAEQAEALHADLRSFSLGDLDAGVTEDGEPARPHPATGGDPNYQIPKDPDEGELGVGSAAGRRVEAQVAENRHGGFPGPIRWQGSPLIAEDRQLHRLSLVRSWSAETLASGHPGGASAIQPIELLAGLEPYSAGSNGSK
jgi:hypothetical protein